jgi:glycosyltransferase involved in cell wall biosynthesis
VRTAYTLEQCWHRVPGGTAVAAIECARSMAAETAVELVGVAALHRRPAPPPYEPPIPVRHVYLPRPALYDAWHLFRRPQVQVVTGSIDAIHATSLAIPPKSAPLVVTIHDLAFLSFPDYFTRRGLRFFRRGLELALKEADLVLCPSEATLAHCVDAGFERDRLEVVPLGVSTTQPTAAEVERIRTKYGLDHRYILFAGTIEPRKNLTNLLKALRRLGPEPQLVLVGPKGWNQDLDALVGDARSRVKVLGFVSPGDRDALYAGASVLCAPSLLEGFGFPVLESMSLGTPVVTSRGTSTEELAGDAAVLIDPREPQSIAEGLSTVLEDDVLANKLRELGRKRASTYTWSRTAALTARAYARVVA